MKREFYEEKKGERIQRTQDSTDKKDQLDDYDELKIRVAGYNLQELKLDDVRALLISDGIAKYMYGLIGEGKEANVYWIETPEGKFQAAKMFRIYGTTHKAKFARHNAKTTDRFAIAEGLCMQEYQNLHFMYDAGVLVPKPIGRKEFFYLMEFLGDENGPSPLLGEVNLRELGVDPVEVLDNLLDELDVMFNNAQMVHGDFSEHNIVWHDEKAWIIDVYQSQRWHPRYDTESRIKKNRALKVLKKDIAAIINYFQRTYRIAYDIGTVFELMIDDPVEDWIPEGMMSESFDVDAYVKMQKRVDY